MISNLIAVWMIVERKFIFCWFPMLVRLNNLRKMTQYKVRLLFFCRNMYSRIVRTFSGDEMPVAECHAGIFINDCTVRYLFGNHIPVLLPNSTLLSRVIGILFFVSQKPVTKG